MSKLTYLSNWNPELCIQLETECNQIADFNRLLVIGGATTSQLQQSGSFEIANRETCVRKLKHQFDEAIKEGESHLTLYALFSFVSHFLQWCDKNDVEAFSKVSIEGYMTYQKNRVMCHEIKRSTYSQISSKLNILATRYLDLPRDYFNNIAIMGRADTEPFQAYTRSDLNQLLPFLRRIFNQTYQQFVNQPEKHIKVGNSTRTMSFTWQGKSYQLCGGVSKMMCAGTFLLAYYTYTNTGDLFKLKQPKNVSTSLDEVWYTMPAFKRRAFKTIQVEMGGHDILEVPKYAMSFFDKLLHASKILNDDEGALLLKTVVKNKTQPIKSTTLNSFLKDWVEKHFTFTDQTGRRLRPVVSRFRETGAQLTAYHQGEFVNDMMLNNTQKIRKRHYSKGNKHTNNGMLQDALSIRQEQIQSQTDAKHAQANLGIDVLVVEEEYKASIPNLSRTPSGSGCATPFGKKSEKYTRKAQSRGLLKKGEKLACADLLGCFGCPDQVIVQAVNDIWCLLSFKACIEESLYLHLDAHHYRKNFESVVTFIETKILPHLKTNILKQAESKLNDGYHPLWNDSESILELIPQPLSREA
ncbi:hypothetical protein [Vibrio splendidus]|uniref:hypothetical protein n=1 Tax=Vibrio splendidus TaxID=29497 RepID=UPI000D360B1F|nr:hypothetical protein [Vibrio splendidus]PTO54666.1 hypothetical protein CWN82_18530 [Vibrio splendidus]